MLAPFRSFQRLVAESPGTPFVTWYGPGGARAELSRIAFANGVAKTLGLLVDDLDAQPGDSLLLDLGLHWQLPVFLAAADAAGLDAIIAAGPGDPTQGAHGGAKAFTGATFVATNDPAVAADPARRPAGEMILVSASALGLPGPPAPAGVVDHAREAMGQPDRYTGPVHSGRVRSGARMLDADGVRVECETMAAAAGALPGARVAVRWETGAAADDAALACYPLPVLLGGSVVLCADPGTDISVEKSTATVIVGNPSG